MHFMSLFKKFLALFLAFLIITPTFTLPVYAESISGSSDSFQKAEYLLDEDFGFLSTSNNPSDVQVSGWDTRAAGGSVSYQFYSWFKVSDTSNILPVTMNKKFKLQSSGRITLEFRFKPTTIIDGLKWQLRSSTTIGVNIYTNGKNIYMESAGNTPVLLQEYAANTEYGVKVITDITGKTADIFINGELKATNIAFKNSVQSLDNFNFSTGETSTGEVYLPTVRIYKGYTVNEKFITTMTNVPKDWTTSSSGGDIVVEKVNNASPPDTYSIKMDATNAASAMTFQKNIPAQAGAQVFEYKMLIPTKVDGLSSELMSGNTSILKLVTSNGSICYADASGQLVPVYDYIANLWYSIKIKYNADTGKADIYINSKMKKEGADITISIGGIDSIRYSTSAANKGIMYLDDIQLYNDTPLPADYVPAPQKVASNGVLVGTQSCSMWKEGNHLGWDRINPYKERTPLLGYYDEGNTETADWEIKWMAEHGIGFQMFCWFRDRGSGYDGKPIKEPDLSAGLNEGYMNAKYSDLVKFTFMWENQTSKLKGSADFRSNVVPYWSEYYFKDPRFLVVDNKPVIAVYSMSALKKDFGTVENVKAEMDYLRSEVKKLGYDDAILLISNSNADPVAMSECKAAGFDAVFAYSWGSNGGYPDIQEVKMEQQRDAGAIDMVPVVSMGRDDSAWGGAPGYYSTSAEFQSALQWTRDDFIPSLPSTSPGKKMILLDNWNEYGEGHFILPSNLNGFGYVDAVRNVFTSGGIHEDAMPTQAQKDRVCVLYPQNRDFPEKTVTVPAVTNTYSRQWNFNTDGDREGWGATSDDMRDLDNITVQNGVLSATATGNDPWIVSPNNLGLNAEDNPYIHIRMKNGSGSTSGKVYFITDTDQTWNETKRLYFFAKANDEGYTDYYVNMWTCSSWAGRIKAFRIDPFDTTGSFGIDFVGVVYSRKDGIKTYIDGHFAAIENQSKIIDGCVMVPVEDVYGKLNIPKQWDENNEKLIAVKGGTIYKLTPGETTAYKGNTAITLEHAPVLVNGVLYAPASYVKQAFGYIVSWNEQDQEISIYTVSLTWNFTADEGWTANERISNGRISNGYYLGTSMGAGANGEEGYITSRDKLNMDAASVKRIRINYKNSTPGNELKLYFTTAADSTWDTSKMITLPAVASDGEYREYIFDTSSFSNWNGVIKQIRIVPTNSAGDFGIDYIKMDITSSIPVKGENLVIDPGMELGSNNQITSTSNEREYTTTQAHSGKQSIKVTKQSTYASIYFRTGQQVKGQEYYYSAWLKLDPDSFSLKGSTPQNPVARVCIQYRLDGVTKQYIMFTSPKLSTTEWQQVQGTYKVNETGTVTDICMFVFTDVPAVNDTYYIDDVEIRPVTYTASPEWVYVSDISLNKTNTTIGLGKVQSLTATVKPDNALNKAVKWSSDNTNVAIVDNYGYVYGKGEGTANITSTTAECGKTATCAVTVKEGYYETVTLTVKPDGTGDFLSPKLANDSITDSSAGKHYVILVYPGVYTEKNWIVKQYTTIRGTDRDTCWLKGENPEDATNSQMTDQSTIWLKPTANLENLKITCKNMRYPVHSEDSGGNKDAVHNITNCYVEHYGNLEAVQYRQRWIAAHPGVTPSADLDPNQVWGGASGVGSHAWGFGSASGEAESFYDSTFVSKSDGWYVHNNKNFTLPQISTINDSKIVSTVTSNPITVQSLGSGTKDQVIFNNCEITGTYILQNDWPWLSEKAENQYANHADYTVTLNNCTPVGYLDGHKGRALAIFSNSTGSASNVRVSGNAVSDILEQYTTKDGGGTLKGYIYGYWDISGIKVGLNSDVTVNNTLGRRLGNCTTANKTLNVTFEDGTVKSIVFNEDYITQTNAYIIGKINSVLGSSGFASEYNVTANEYYPQVTDKQLTMTNNTNVGIPRFSAVCYDSDAKNIRLMKASDSADMFLGITLEGIAPGQSGRVLTEGILNKTQLNGFNGSIEGGTKISVSAKDGSFEVNSANPIVLQGVRTDWAYFKGNTKGAFELLDLTTDKTFLKTGSTASLTLTGKMNNGITADLSQAQITFTSSNEQIAKVSQTGTITAVGEGIAKIRATVKIAEMTKEAEVQITVDGTAAVTAFSISGTAVNGWYSGDVKVTLTSSDNLSGVDRTEYRLGDNDDWSVYSAPISITQDGSYIIQYRTIDKAGNIEAVKQENFKADCTAPVSTVTVSGTVYGSDTYNSHVVVTLYSEDAAGGSGIALIQYSYDGITWLTYTVPLELTDNGTYSISYKASDNAGNVETVRNEILSIFMEPQVMVTYLMENIKVLSINEGIKNSLLSKLEGVLSSILQRESNSAVSKLNAFINEVDAQTGKKITNEQSDMLKIEVNKIFTRIKQP